MQTVGPSNESKAATSSIGVACHISAAASGRGARRYDKQMTSEQRRAIDNGIWMCATHGRLIDTDESHFTVEMLKRWRDLAEMRARYELESGQPLINEAWEGGFVQNTLTLKGGEVDGTAIGNALIDSCVSELWGNDICFVARDVIVEIALNAWQHGHAHRIRLEIDGHCVRVIDDGRSFDPRTLRRTDRELSSGGVTAVSYVLNRLSDSVIVDWRRDSDLNVTTFSLLRRLEDALELVPCCVELNPRGDWYSSLVEFKQASDRCDTLYIVIRGVLNVSDLGELAIMIVPYIRDGQRLVFVGRQLSKIVLNGFPHMLPPDAVIVNLP